MGIGGISIWQLLFILIIVLLVFGTKKLRNVGGDLGGAIRGFKDAMGKDSILSDDSIEGKTVGADELKEDSSSAKTSTNTKESA